MRSLGTYPFSPQFFWASVTFIRGRRTYPIFPVINDRNYAVKKKSEKCVRRNIPSFPNSGLETPVREAPFRRPQARSITAFTRPSWPAVFRARHARSAGNTLASAGFDGIVNLWHAAREGHRDPQMPDP